MLKSLYDYAVRHDLTLPPGYVNKTIKAYISLSAHSDYLGVTMGDSLPHPCPDIGSLANGTEKSNVIVEKRSVVLPKEETSKSRFFLEALRSASETNPTLRVCVSALENEETRQRLRLRLDEARIKPADRISFEVDGQSILESPSLLAWWQEYRKQFQKDDASKTRCLITGEFAVPMVTTPSIQGLYAVGGHPRGDALICFDKAAFASYGLKQSANAPVSEEAYAGVKAALDTLLDKAPVIAGMKFVHWFDADIQPQEDPILICEDFGDFDFGEDDEEDPMEQANRESAANQAATELVKSVYSGERNKELGTARYHILLLSGVNGRVMIRRYEEGDYAELKRNLDQWNEDLRLMNLYGTQTLKGCKLPARMLQLLKVQKKDKNPFERAGKELVEEAPAILQSILNGTALPDSVAMQALRTIRSLILSDEEKDKLFNYHLGVACQWLKIWLIRNQQKGDLLMPGYNDQNPSAAYQSGAILAIYERIQDRANPDVNVTVVQRYYASAIQAPALVIGRLSQLSIHHLRDIERRSGKGLRIIFSNLLSNTYAIIDGKIPTVLTLTEQAEFALGYYQMTAKLNADKL